MAINFAAANMAGYNNPQIEVVTLVMDKKGNFIKTPTYEIISKILGRGAIPFLAVTNAPRSVCSVLPLSYYDTEQGFMQFSQCTQNAPADQNTMLFLSVRFRSGSGTPTLKQIPFKPTIS